MVLLTIVCLNDKDKDLKADFIVMMLTFRFFLNRRPYN